MKNSDFRAMLQAAQQRTPVSVAESPAVSDEKPAAKAKKERKFYKPKAEKAEKAAPAYRDRAAERREAKDEEEEFATMPATATQFLGGDEQHTHLVKGLDVALLEKVRAEQAAAANKKQLLEEFGSDSDSGGAADNEVETLGTRLLALLEEKPAATASRTALALFTPGRMAYLFDLEQPQDVPTMELRALGASTKAASKRSMAAVPHPLIEEIANILAYGAAGKGRPRAKPVSEVPVTSPVAVGATQVTLLATKKRAIADDEKIFSESSDEEGEAQKKQKTDEAEEAPVVAKGSYFGGSKTEQKTADPLAAVLGISAAKVEAAARALEKQKEAEKRREEKQLEMTRAAAERASAAGGAYGSYLQRTVAAGVVAGKEVDPEEEGKKSRFIVEEDDEVDDEAILRRYRETLEGVGDDEQKKGKGRRKGRKKGAEDAEADKKKHKKNHDKMKTNQELEKIERLMKEKKKE